VPAIIRHRIESRKRRLARRLDKCQHPYDLSQPRLRGGSLMCELASRAAGTATTAVHCLFRCRRAKARRLMTESKGSTGPSTPSSMKRRPQIVRV
jgi:hypothetical protein